MNSTLYVQLNASAEQMDRLKALQTSFSEVCNALGPIVQQNRCWNRVALHHLAYRSMRELFPQVGSQMVCNAIYSVSRMCRVVLQHPDSPWNISKHGGRPLPLLKFLPSSPVYFDRHTLSLKNGRLSMYTLDGRMHFDIDIGVENEARFHNEKLREIVLGSNPQGFVLSFYFSPESDVEEESAVTGLAPALGLPEYLLIVDATNASPLPSAYQSSLPSMNSVAA